MIPARGTVIGIAVTLAISPTAGIIAGGVLGPFVGLLVPKAEAHETAPIGSEPSARRYSMPGTPLESDDARLYLDTNLDGRISAADALQLINYFLSGAQVAAAPSAVSMCLA